MRKSNAAMAREIAQVASKYESEWTGHAPEKVTVVLSESTLVITLHGALSPAERELAKSKAGATQVQEFRRQLFANSCAPLLKEIHRITGVEVREAIAEVETATGTVVQAFTADAVVQVYLMAHSMSTDSWAEAERGGES